MYLQNNARKSWLKKRNGKVLLTRTTGPASTGAADIQVLAVHTGGPGIVDQLDLLGDIAEPAMFDGQGGGVRTEVQGELCGVIRHWYIVTQRNAVYWCCKQIKNANVSLTILFDQSTVEVGMDIQLLTVSILSTSLTDHFDFGNDTALPSMVKRTPGDIRSETQRHLRTTIRITRKQVYLNNAQNACSADFDKGKSCNNISQHRRRRTQGDRLDRFPCGPSWTASRREDGSSCG